jgi:sugar/nucleoside kinase (ribokinase family)
MHYLQKLKLALVAVLISFCLIVQTAPATQLFKNKRSNPAWQQKSQDLFVISNAMYDILIKVDDNTLSKYSSKYNIKKGFNGIIDRESLYSIIKESTAEKQMAGGGSINTASGLVNLGGSSALSCIVSLDEFGKKFHTSVVQEGITPMIKFREKSNTGIVLIFITPDGERTMFANQGERLNFKSSDVDYDSIKQYKVLLTDGYTLLDKNFKPVFFKAVSKAKATNTHFAFALSACGVVEQHRDFILSNVPNIDILFGNESEVMTLFGTSDLDQAIAKFQKIGNIGVFTMGSKGAIIVTKQGTIIIPPEKIAKVVDTTGAGDMFAAGFLHGYTRGLDLQTCGTIGSKAAAYIIQQLGARSQTKISYH